MKILQFHRMGWLVFGCEIYIEHSESQFIHCHRIRETRKGKGLEPTSSLPRFKNKAKTQVVLKNIVY